MLALVMLIQHLLTSRPAYHDDRGASAVEYGLLVALIAAVIVVAVTLIGTNLTSVFDKVAHAI
jgi:pilus assembly protein Flp/PilA